MSRKLLSATLCAASLATPLVAQADDDRLYVSGMAQYVMFDDDKPFESDLGLMLGIGMPIHDKFVLELTYFTRSVDIQSLGGSVDQDGFGIDGMIFWDGRDGQFDPYFAIGFSEVTDDYGLTDSDYGSAQFALGFFDDITDNFSWRAELRAYRNDDSFAGTDLAVGVGVTYMFGAKPESSVAPMAAPAPAPAPAPVAAAAPVAAVAVVDPDSDGDGVKDSADACPNTPAGRAVGANGCELDSDGDGVVDSADKCPGTPAGAKVLANGCEVPKVVKLEGVNFTSGTANFVAGANESLDKAVQALKDNPTISVEIAGHTDSQGDGEMNRKLSQQRANAVQSYFVSNGIEASRLTAKGYGEDEPAASNDTNEGRAANRRVELRVKQ